MKFTGSIVRSQQADMRAELCDLERAVASGTRDAGRELKSELRRQVGSAGLGQRHANSWRDQYYPNQRPDAANLIYTKAPQIVRAFDEGAVIRSRGGRFLAIPTENAPRKGTDGRRICPSTFPEHRFGLLRFVPRSTGPSLLVVDGLRASFSRKTGELARLPARHRSSPTERSGSDHGGDVPAGPQMKPGRGPPAVHRAADRRRSGFGVRRPAQQSDRPCAGRARLRRDRGGHGAVRAAPAGRAPGPVMITIDKRLRGLERHLLPAPPAWIRWMTHAEVDELEELYRAVETGAREATEADQLRAHEIVAAATARMLAGELPA
jgi:hypothetical protein